MAKNPAFLLYASDFLTGTMFMTLDQRGAYITLLCVQFEHGAFSNAQALQICGESTWQVVKAKFQQDESGLWFNKRLMDEIQKRNDFRTKMSTRAKKAAEARWNNKKEDASSNATSMQQAVLVQTNIEDGNENENRNVKEEDDGIVYPFDSEKFSQAWSVWLDERKQRRVKKYTSRGEQAALHMLQKMSGGNEDTAIKIINQSIANSWTGLFALKNNQTQQSNGKSVFDLINEQHEEGSDQ